MKRLFFSHLRARNGDNALLASFSIVAIFFAGGADACRIVGELA
ncbi:MAG: hypothetical protein ACM3TN_03045 [Alphaproteobacteria bacterium]